MKRYQKIISGIAAISLAATVAACERKKDPAVKTVKTEKVIVAPNTKASSSVSLESLDVRVSDIERRMAVARKQYAKDKAELQRRLGGVQ